MKRWMLGFSIILFSGKALAAGDPPDFILEWGSNGAGDGQFGGAHGIEVDADGNVYVAYTGNNRIQKFTSDGVFLIKWGTFGSPPGQFNHPHGIGIGPMGNLFVAETGNNRVQKFTNDGQFITMWGSFGAGDGQFNLPYAIRAGANGVVYVSDSSNFRVQKFAFAVPAVSPWGTIVMLLLFLGVATIILRRTAAGREKRFKGPPSAG